MYYHVSVHLVKILYIIFYNNKSKDKNQTIFVLNKINKFTYYLQF